MTLFARQSTAQIVTVGPVLDADGVAVTGGVVGDFKISKNGGAPAALNASATLTHRHTGFYSLSLTATDLNTVGTVEVTIDDTVNTCPMKQIQVVEEAVYDALFAASALGYVANQPVNIAQISGDATAADNCEAFFDGTGYAGTNNLIGTVQNATLANGAHGGAAATLALKTLTVTADANNTAVTFSGSGTGEGLRISGGPTGDGVEINGGVTSGVGLKILTSDGTGIAVGVNSSDVAVSLDTELGAGTGTAQAGSLTLHAASGPALSVISDSGTAASFSSDGANPSITLLEGGGGGGISGQIESVAALNPALLDAAVSTRASSTEVVAIQNNTRVVRVVPTVIERPDSGTVTYRIELLLYDAVGNMEAPDSAPTIALVNQAGTDRSSRLDSVTMANVATGHYRAIYTASAGDALEQLIWTFAVVEGGATRSYGNASLIVDTTAVDFTAADRAKLDTLHDTRLTAQRAANLDNLDAAVSTRLPTANITLTGGGVTLANGVTHGGAAATITLAGLTVAASGNNTAVTIAGAGTGEGLRISGGETGDGIEINGGTTSGRGVVVLTSAASLFGNGVVIGVNTGATALSLDSGGTAGAGQLHGDVDGDITGSIGALAANAITTAAIQDGAITDAKFTVPTITGVATGVLSMIVQVWRYFFKKKHYDIASGTIKTYADNGTSVLTSQTVTVSATDEDVGAAT